MTLRQMSEFIPVPAAPRRLGADSVMPDCCNIGVIFRSLLAVNLTVFVAILLRTGSGGLMAGVSEFVEASMLVEWACLLSLFALCAVRRLQLVLPRLLGAPWLQRALCALVPALVTGAIIRFLLSFDWFRASFSRLSLLEGMLLAALFGALLQHYFELRTRAFSPALVEARLQALQARIRPHFLFNSLNAVLSLIRSEPQRAESTLEDLADLFRVLMRDARDMTSLLDEISLCQKYLSIESIRLGERLQVQWETSAISDEVLRKAQVSALLLQPLLENAVRYGIEPGTDAGLIRIVVARSLDRIEIVVSNPHLEQASTAAGNQMALNNIRERLALLYDVEAQLSSGIVDGQFEVRLRFPYVKIDLAKGVA
jgi:two-component system, LytTR family, sensor histidine kinase AlgZ